MFVLTKKETRSMRGLEFRVDGYGIYLLAYESQELMAGISYQYPRWFSELFTEPSEHIMRNSLRLWNWGEPK